MKRIAATKWQVLFLLMPGILLTGVAAHADKSPAINEAPVGKPRAPVHVSWSPTGDGTRIEAELLALEDFDEMVLRLVVPGSQEQYPIRRLEKGRRGQLISVSWDGWPEIGIPRLLVTMAVRERKLEHSLAYPVRSIDLRNRLDVEMSRHHREGRVDRAKDTVVLPAADDRLP
ncbi:MAG: hypothetical protein ACR2QU_08430 [Gammaproteobacteria bacterium]